MLIVKPGSNALTELEPIEEPLPAIGAEEIEPRFRAVVGRGGERRGIRLERIYWDGLGRMSSAGKMSTADLVHYTASQMPESGNLASLLRVLSFKWALRRLDLVEDASSMANVNAIIQASPSPTILLTQEKKIQLFNDPFLTMLRQRLPLGDFAERKHDRRELLLGQAMQEVRLVLGAVDGLEKLDLAVRGAPQARVVARGDAVGAERQRMVEERAELDLAVAEDVRVRRAPGLVVAQEQREHALAVFGGEVDRLEIDADDVRDRGRVDQVLAGRAVFVGIVLLPVLHEEADDLVALLLQQPRRDRRVDAARHADDDSLPACHQRFAINPSGQRLPAR